MKSRLLFTALLLLCGLFASAHEPSLPSPGGPGAKVLAHFGFTKEHVTAEALRLLGRTDLANAIEPETAGGETAGEEAKGGEGHS